MTMIGKPAPNWTAAAYLKGEEKEISSTDYAGKWYVLYWYPLDFTFVCPTEIREFEKLADDFDDDNCAVIGCSTDSFFSHKNWFEDGKTFADGVSHPVIADTSHAISRLFDVLKEDAGIAYRATVIVDDKGTVRSIAVNDLDAGRNPAETLRTVQALQSGGLCGVNWSKGDDFAG